MRPDVAPATTVDPQRVDVVVDGCRTATFCYGPPDAPTVLALHGFRGTHFGLDPLARALVRHGFRVIAPDAPGCGVSERLTRPHDVDGFTAWFAAFARACGEPATLLGHSFGSVVVAAAASRELRPRHVVLVNPVASLPLKGVSRAAASLARTFYAAAGRLPERAGHALLAHRMGARVSAAVMTTTRDRSLRRWIRDEHLRQVGAFADRESVLQQYRAASLATVVPFAPTLTCPTLIIGAGRDQLSPVSAVQGLGALVPEASVHILPGQGHLIPYEAPDAAASLISSWVVDQQPT